MSENLNKKEGSDSPDYPTVLDVVIWKDTHYQVVGIAQTKSYKNDLFTVQGLEDKDTPFRIKGARFHRTISQDPPEGRVYKREEGVRVTGELLGGKRHI